MKTETKKNECSPLLIAFLVTFFVGMGYLFFLIPSGKLPPIEIDSIARLSSVVANLFRKYEIPNLVRIGDLPLLFLFSFLILKVKDEIKLIKGLYIALISSIASTLLTYFLYGLSLSVNINMIFAILTGMVIAFGMDSDISFYKATIKDGLRFGSIAGLGVGFGFGLIISFQASFVIGLFAVIGFTLFFSSIIFIAFLIGLLCLYLFSKTFKKI